MQELYAAARRAAEGGGKRGSVQLEPGAVIKIAGLVDRLHSRGAGSGTAVVDSLLAGRSWPGALRMRRHVGRPACGLVGALYDCDEHCCNRVSHL